MNKIQAHVRHDDWFASATLERGTLSIVVVDKYNAPISVGERDLDPDTIDGDEKLIELACMSYDAGETALRAMLFGIVGRLQDSAARRPIAAVGGCR